MNSSGSAASDVAEIQELGHTISPLVNGGNYAAGFEYIALGNVQSLDDVVTAINKRYTKSQLQKENIVPGEDWPAAWQEIAECIWYGIDANDGDMPNRPPRSQEAIEQLGQVRDRMKTLLDTLVGEKAKIYTFYGREEINLDDYVVYWAYRFVVINPNGNAYLLHGSASD